MLCHSAYAEAALSGYARAPAQKRAPFTPPAHWWEPVRPYIYLCMPLLLTCASYIRRASAALLLPAPIPLLCDLVPLCTIKRVRRRLARHPDDWRHSLLLQVALQLARPACRSSRWSGAAAAAGRRSGRAVLRRDAAPRLCGRPLACGSLARSPGPGVAALPACGGRGAAGAACAGDGALAGAAVICDRSMHHSPWLSCDRPRLCSRRNMLSESLHLHLPDMHVQEDLHANDQSSSLPQMCDLRYAH